MLKSRVALTALIVLGALMSGTGATLAVTGSSGSGSAEQQQYTTPTTTTTPTPPPNDTPPSNDTSDGGPTLAPQQEVAGDESEGGSSTDDSEPAEQVEVASDGEDSLPFTGFLAIPLLFGGVAMIAVGGVLRHRSRDSK